MFIYVLSRDSEKTFAVIWTKLEEKQEIQIEFVTVEKPPPDLRVVE